MRSEPSKSQYFRSHHMSSLISKILIFSAATVLAACATSPGPRAVESASLSSVKRVAVVSALGDEFNGVKVGLTVFGNEYFNAKVADWAVDAYVERKAEELLSSHVDAKSLTPLIGPGDRAGSPETKGLWFQAARSRGYDTLFLISAQKSENYPFHRPPYGFHDRKLGSIPELPGIKGVGLGGRCVYAMYIVQLFDVKTEKELAWQWGGTEPCQKDADNDLFFQSRFDHYNESQRAEFRNRLFRQIDRSLDEVVKKFGIAK